MILRVLIKWQSVARSTAVILAMDAFDTLRLNKYYRYLIGDVRVLFNKFDKRTFLSHGTLETLIKHKEFGKKLLCEPRIAQCSG